jgi:ornithine racemase
MSTHPTQTTALPRARLLIDLRKVEQNTRAVVGMLGGLGVVGVTKCVCGAPQVAAAMLAGGAAALAESRHENAQRLRDGGITAPLWLLRMPSPALAADTVRLFDVSLATELETCAALDAAARARGVRHKVIAMVELGDLREGLMPADLPDFVEAVERLPGLELAGVGTNLTCYGAIVPDAHNMTELVGLAAAAERLVGRPLLVSGGNSGAVPLVLAGAMPHGISSLRLGETILHGTNTLTRAPIAGLHQDVFTLEAPVVEAKLKPSLPYGCAAQSAWGDEPDFEDRGVRRRAICGLGRQDCRVEGLTPLEAGVTVLGASSDHLVLDVDDMAAAPHPGDALRFRPDYATTVQLNTSPYVEKQMH